MFGNAREALLHYVLEKSLPNDIKGAIKTIDEFCWTHQPMMNIGDKKGQILDQALQTRQPKSVLELGTFLGYSSLRIVSQLPQDALFVTIEANPESAAIARRIHEHAGAGNRIHIVVDRSEQAISRLREQFHVNSFDFIFIDHHKEAYLSDFKLLEEAGLVKSGTVIAADNIIRPGAPDYADYVRNNPNYTSILHESTLGYNNNDRDGVEISIRK